MDDLYSRLSAAVAQLDNVYNSTYSTPEAILALKKTIKTFNITINDWNSLINSIHTTGSTLAGLYQIIPDLTKVMFDQIQHFDGLSTKEYVNEKYSELTQLVSDSNAGQFPIISSVEPQGDIVTKQLWIDIGENDTPYLNSLMASSSQESLSFGNQTPEQTPFYISDNDDTIYFEDSDNLTFGEEGNV